VLPQDLVLNHISGIRNASGGPKAESQMARREADAAEHAIADGDKLYPLSQVIYLRGESTEDLRRKANAVRALLIGSGIQPIAPESDLTALDTYIRTLPMNFDPRRERLSRPSRRSRLVYTSQIAALFPTYGRARGTGHPGFLFYNRGGDPIAFDPLHREDRKKSAHLLIIGPTGSGKSATVIYLLMQMMAIYRPRLFIIDGKNSFRLLAQYFRAHGLSVNFVRVAANTDVSLPPFADAFKALEAEADLAARIEAALETPDKADDEALLAQGEEEVGDGARDYLGEMEIAARLMITGGDERQEARIVPSDRLLIRLAILGAAGAVQKAGRLQVLTQDVVEALRAIATDTNQSERRRARAEDLADAMELFCSGLAGRLFNRPGTAWPEADVTIFEAGQLARDGYQSQLALAYVGLINHITGLVERHQQDNRQTLVLTDEGHVVTTNPLLSPYAVKITNSDILNALFRSVPPALALALAMTEKHEKAERARIMEDKQCSELEAAYEVARRLERSRAELTEAEAQSTSRGAL
jgi:conjugative transfer ATPase